MLDKSISFLKMIAGQNQYYLLIYAALFILFYIAVYRIIKYEQEHNRFEHFKARFKANLAKQEELKAAEYKRQLEADGEFKEKDRMRRIAKKLQDSGLKNKFPELTSGAFMIAVIFLSIIVAVFTFIWTNHALLFSLISMAITYVLVYVYLELKISKNQKAIRKEIVKFINILENMSYSEGNITEMLGATVPYLSEPLKGSVEKCYYEIRSTGNVPVALQHLVDRTNYKKLKEVFNSLRICSMHNEDYETVIEENKETIRIHVATCKEEDQIKRNTVIDMVTMLGLLVLVLKILESVVTNMKDLMFNTLIGQGLLTAIFGLLIYGVWFAIKSDD